MPDIDLCNFVNPYMIHHVAIILCIVYNSSQNLAIYLDQTYGNSCALACLMAMVCVSQHECVSPYFTNIKINIKNNINIKISESLKKMSRPRK